MSLIFTILFLVSTTTLAATIIGGQVADESSENDGIFEFRVSSATTLNMYSLCTATKIAENAFLTAAHCFNSNRSPSFINISKKIKNQDFKYEAIEVERLEIHSTYLKGSAILREFDAAIVLVKPTTLFSSLMSRSIDFTHVKFRTPVEYYGFGCQKTNNDTTDSFPVKKHAQNETLQEAILKKNYGTYSRYVNYYSKEIYRVHLLTSGLTKSPDSSSLCSGDSGGPVFVNNRLVGINVTYLDNFDNEGVTNQGATYVNLHVRLSPLKRWIENNVPNLAK